MTDLTVGAVKLFLAGQYKVPVEILETHHGEFSQAYLFEVQQQKRIIRINPSSAGFTKDQIISRSYPHIPAVSILEIGRLSNGNAYCISEALVGSPLHRLEDWENMNLLPELFEIMNRIHLSDIKHSGYGKWDIHSTGKYASWYEALQSLFEADQWQLLAESVKFFDLKLLSTLRKEFQKLERFIPQDRHLLHGDFGRTNILAHNGKITGVIDWSEAMVGDPLFDLAWIAFWPEKIRYIQQYYEHNQGEPKLNLRHYHERLLAYFIVIGIHSLVFMAKRNRGTEYHEVIDALRRLTELTL
jgi:hygromycin-B 4-O-kinase